MNRYVKVEGHPEWFMLLSETNPEPDGLSENMQERIFRSHVCKLHDDSVEARLGLTHRIIMTATRNLDYTNLVNKYGAILVREIGSYMLLHNSKIVDEIYSDIFPITEFADIVICENDEKSEYEWNKYLMKRFPGKTIKTINYFDLRDEKEIEKYFEKARFITFSTTFSKFEWFEKLTKYASNKHTVIGYCHDPSKWEDAIKINKNVQIIESIKF